jgi:hypothetical protein
MVKRLGPGSVNGESRLPRQASRQGTGSAPDAAASRPACSMRHAACGGHIAGPCSSKQRIIKLAANRPTLLQFYKLRFSTPLGNLDWHQQARASTTAFYQTTNFLTRQDGLSQRQTRRQRPARVGFVIAAIFSPARPVMLTQVCRRFELFVLTEGEKKITEKVVSGRC